MKNKIFLATAIVAIALTSPSFYSCTERTVTYTTENTIQTTFDGLRGWSDDSRIAVLHMLDTYGEPDEMSSEMMLWNNTGQWKRTVVYAQGISHDFPIWHTDVIQQWINYDVPAEKLTELSHFNGSVVSNRTNGEISARCDVEGANFLALNLAHDIIKGNKSVESAKEFYASTIKDMINGGDPAYMQKLQFDVASTSKADSDNPSSIITQDDISKMKEMKEKMKDEMMNMAARNHADRW